MILIDLKKKKSKRRELTKNTWYDWFDWLINYIPKPIKKPWVTLKTNM